MRVANVDFQAYVFLVKLYMRKNRPQPRCELANADPGSGRRSCRWLL